ncbi:MAG: histidine kinase [Sporocytophaga sp.]|nr:histidine kinase [Sporocytophaga sp.]
MQYSIPFKVLVRESGKLFLFFLVGTVLITSFQELSLKGLLIKFITLSTLFISYFAINIGLISFFDKRRKYPGERIWRKTFAMGYPLTLIIFTLQHALLLYLHNTGIFVQKSLPGAGVEPLNAWQLAIFISYANFVLYSFIFLIHNFVIDQYEKNRIQMELLQLKASNMETTNQLLQQQIKPHFLFNALNILKSLIRKDPKSAETYLLKLSDFLRVSITKNKNGTATIREELKICNDYMEMQKIRFGDALIYHVNLNESDEFYNQKLPFFSIQPLLENAIKHNELTPENPLCITIEKEGNSIIVQNNLQLKTNVEVSTGNGHSILKERYKLLTGDDVQIDQNDKAYSVSLKILDE